MAQDILHVTITDDGSARVITKDLNNLGKAGDKATSSVKILGGALAGIGAAAVVREVFRLNDEFTRMTNTLRPGFESLNQTRSALAELADAAARSNSELGIAVDVYDTLADATERLGVSHERIVPISETLLKQFQIGGQSAGQAASTIKTLGAAIASNDFSRGINSLLRQNLDFTNALAKAYGSNSEELRAWAKDGRLSVESFLAATERMREQTDHDFGMLGKTYSQAQQELADATTLFVGNLVTQTDAGRGATTVVSELAAALRGLAGNQAAMNDFAQGLASGFRAVEATATQALAVIVGISRAGIAISKRGGLLTAMMFGDTRTELQDIFNETKSIIEQARNIDENSVFRPRATPSPVAAPPPGSSGGGVDPRSLLGAGRTAERSAASELAEAARAAEQSREAFARLRGEYDPLVAAGQSYAESVNTINEALRRGQTDQQTAVELLKQVTAAHDEARNASSKAALEGFDRLRASLDPAAAAGMEYAATVREINAALAANPGLQGQAVELLQLATDKYTKAREEIAGKGKDGGIMGAIAGQFDGALNSLVNFANTGQASLGQFATSAVADLQRVFLQLLLVKSLGALGGSVGGGAGGVLTSLASMIGGQRANGGPVSPGKAFLVGERGPELFVPPGRGNVIANDALGGGAPPQVHVQVVNVSDPSEIPRAMQSREGQQAILNTISRNPAKSRAAMGS